MEQRRALTERVRGIIFLQDSNTEIIVLQRNKKKQQYYVFPGGGIENCDVEKAKDLCPNGRPDELKKSILEITMKREAKEELGIEVEVGAYIDCVLGKAPDCEPNHFVICRQIGGTLGTGIGEEFTPEHIKVNGTTIPVIVHISEINHLHLYPEQIQKLILLNYLDYVKQI